MWFLGGFGRILRSMWRLLIGLVIGAVLYVWLFFEYKHVWEGTHKQVTHFMDWLVSQPMLAEYSQWSTLLNLDDKVTFALFIMVGRIIWLFIEALLFAFPRWLIFGRGPKTTPLGGNDGIPQRYLDDVTPQAATAVPAAAMAAPGQQGTGLESAIDKVADKGMKVVSEKVASGLEGLGNDAEAAKLERSIAQTVELVKPAEEPQ